MNANWPSRCPLSTWTDLKAPYRQRLYVLEADEEGQLAWTSIYSLEAPDAAIGLCSAGELGEFSADEVSLREGCGVSLDWDASTQVFEGGTGGESCASSLGGAAYATSEVSMDVDRILSWDRGFDASGAQAWGATAGPYEFFRQD
ncbi:MAG: hypothetical protein GY898_23600 [Proteobacteria bacterium]|nr:hypothetical protein [Pseudomonadota bacterium]